MLEAETHLDTLQLQLDKTFLKEMSVPHLEHYGSQDQETDNEGEEAPKHQQGVGGEDGEGSGEIWEWADGMLVLAHPQPEIPEFHESSGTLEELMEKAIDEMSPDEHYDPFNQNYVDVMVPVDDSDEIRISVHIDADGNLVATDPEAVELVTVGENPDPEGPWFSCFSVFKGVFWKLEQTEDTANTPFQRYCECVLIE